MASYTGGAIINKGDEKSLYLGGKPGWAGQPVGGVSFNPSSKTSGLAFQAPLIYLDKTTGQLWPRL